MTRPAETDPPTPPHRTIEAALAAHDARLKEGARTFARIETELQGLIRATSTKPTNWLAVLGVGISILFPTGALIFAAGRYPDRIEFESTKQRDEQRLEDLRGDVNDLQRELTKLRVQIDSLREGQARVELELGRVEHATGARRKR